MKKIAYIIAAVLIIVLLIFAGYGGVLGCACLASLLFHFWPDFVFLSIVYWISILVPVSYTHLDVYKRQVEMIRYGNKGN